MQPKARNKKEGLAKLKKSLFCDLAFPYYGFDLRIVGNCRVFSYLSHRCVDLIELFMFAQYEKKYIYIYVYIEREKGIDEKTNKRGEG